MSTVYNEIPAADVLEWATSGTPLVRVQTATDVIPGGLSLAMLPLSVDWAESSLGGGPDDFYILHGVNIAANPIEGTTVLGTVKVPVAGLESAEFVMVKSKVGRVETDAGHAQLRFIFKEDQRPHIYTRDDRPIANNMDLPDLVVSWEAWRPPQADFDARAGLKPDTYALSARCYNGSVRCMADAILDRPWVCYPIRLLDVPNATADLLHLALLLGDTIARETLTTLLDNHVREAVEPGGSSDTAAHEWARVKSLIEQNQLPDNPIQEFIDGSIGYHLLLRSCITMALATVDLANVHTHRRHGRDDPKRVQTAPKALPGFLDKLADGNRATTFLAIPAVLHWLTRNQTVVPGKAHNLLDEVGLLQRQDGRLAQKSYDNRQESPYGRLHEHLIF